MNSSWSTERAQYLQSLVRRERARATQLRLRALNWNRITDALNRWFGTHYDSTYLYRRHLRDRRAAQFDAVEYVAGIERPALEPVFCPEDLEVRVLHSGGAVLAKFKIKNTRKNVIESVLLGLARLNVVSRKDQQLLKNLNKFTSKEAVDGNEDRPDEGSGQAVDQG
jgi:hypothetical protein